MTVMEVTLQATYQGQEVINRFNYVATGTPAAVSLSFALCSAMGFVADAGNYPANTLFAAIRGVQTAGVTYQFALAKSVYSDTDFYEVPFVVAAAGTQTAAGDGMPGYVSVGFRTNRVMRSVRRGTKRFCGLAESFVGASNDLTAGFKGGPGATLASKLSETLTYIDEGNTITFAPCVCGKQEYTTPAGNRAYHYFPTEPTQMQHTALGVLWEIYASTRSQVSRQLQRGR